MKKYIYLFFFLIIGAVLTSGFQCASPEITTAKMAYSNKDYEKAELNCEKELSRNPANAEAYDLLIKVKIAMNKWEDAARVALDAEYKITDTLRRADFQVKKSLIWQTLFNKALSSFNTYMSTKQKPLLDSALRFINASITVFPQMPDFYRIQGKITEEMGDTVKAFDIYVKYLTLIDKEIKFGEENKIFLNMTRESAHGILGKPVSNKTSKTSTTDSSIYDSYKINGKELILLSRIKDGKMLVDGWRYDPPASWLDFEKNQLVGINIETLEELAYISLMRKDYGKAVASSLTILKLFPTHPNANSFLVSIYDEQGKRDEAIKVLQDLLVQYPNNYEFYKLLGDMYTKTEKFDLALEQYEKAQKLNSNDYDVLNYAVCVQNKAVKMQRAQADQKEKDPKYKDNPSEYVPLFKKAVELYEKGKTNAKGYNLVFANNQIAMLSYALGDRPRMERTLAEIEAMESTLDPDLKMYYYTGLCGLYGAMKNSEKMQKACAEAEKFKK